METKPIIEAMAEKQDLISNLRELSLAELRDTAEEIAETVYQVLGAWQCNEHVFPNGADTIILALAATLLASSGQQAPQPERGEPLAQRFLEAIGVEAWGFNLPTERLARLIAGDKDALDEPCTPPRAPQPAPDALLGRCGGCKHWTQHASENGDCKGVRGETFFFHTYGLGESKWFDDDHVLVTDINFGCTLFEARAALGQEQGER